MAEIAAAKHKGPEVDNLEAFMRERERGLPFCGDDQSCLSRFSCLVLFPLNLCPALLLSSGDLGSPLIAHAALSCLFC